MTTWQIRIGQDIEREQITLKQGLVCVGWEDLPDLAEIKTIEDLTILCHEIYSHKKPGTVNSWIRQIWTFRERIKLGDSVIIPLKHHSVYAVGKITGLYQYRLDLPSHIHHTRSVEWIRKDIPRSAFEQDILYSLGSLQSICQIQRNNAEERIQAVINRS